MKKTGIQSMFLRALLAGLLLAGQINLAQARVTSPTQTASNADIACWGPSGAEICVDSSGNLIPTTDNDTTLGTSSLRFATGYIVDITVGDDLTVTDDLSVQGDTTLGNAGSDAFAVNASTMQTNTWGLLVSTAADGTGNRMGFMTGNNTLLLPSAADIDDAITPRYVGEIVFNSSTPGEICVSTATNSGAWMQVDDATSACSQ